MNEPCKVCGREHTCVTCSVRPADGGYHICGQCRQRMRKMYAEMERNAREEAGGDG